MSLNKQPSNDPAPQYDPIVRICRYCVKVLQKLSDSILNHHSIRHSEAIIEKLNAKTEMEEAKSVQLLATLEAKQRLSDARETNKKLVADIRAVDSKTTEEKKRHGSGVVFTG